MSNFSFLNNEEYYSGFASACFEAEKSLSVSPSTLAVNCRRALEAAVRWLYRFDEELRMPYQDNLSSLIHNGYFRDIIDARLFPGLKFIKDLGNKAVHTACPVKRNEAVQSLRFLHDFTQWIDYCYSTIPDQSAFNEEILPEQGQETRSREQLKQLFYRLIENDRKLSGLIEENEKLKTQLAAQKAKNSETISFDIEEISEDATRKLFIDLELELAGWVLGHNCLIEVELNGMPNNSGTGFADYVLFGDDGKPLAVVEAKKTSLDPRIGKKQAELYADCLETQHGIRPVVFYTNGFDYYMWDDVTGPARTVSGFYTKEDLQWLHFRRLNRRSLLNPVINDYITGRAYQKMAISAVCDTFEKGRRKALLVMATGSGKTRTAISIVDVLLKNGWIKHILFLADRRNLVIQAKDAFSEMLPELSLCNLLDSKDSPESKMVFSTYPTMMNAIDDKQGVDGRRLFTPGHFDLIIVDESHRSIYKKYKALFDYFDASLVGLTATPKKDLGHNTYAIFELEDENPTYAYEYEEAVKNEYLVPYTTIETSLKLPDEGIHYNELTDEEQEHFEEIFGEDIKDIDGQAINDFLFNSHTVDIVLLELMNRGIKVKGGDLIGKTIIFAKNKKHAEFIIERFGILYPEYKDRLARPIYTGLNYAHDDYVKFKQADKFPQIVVSVDMLDTGVDIPEVVNLVFFKKVRSKAKFHQMIGRGTRLRPDLFGPGLDKKGFLIFDYCTNFEYFRLDKEESDPVPVRSLSEKLFIIKSEIVKALQHLDYQEAAYISHRQILIIEQLSVVNSINAEHFTARMNIKWIEKFKSESVWDNLSDGSLFEIKEHLSKIIPPINDEELAKRFDLLIYTIEFAHITGMDASRSKSRVVETAILLEAKGNITQIKQQAEIIRRVQKNDFWTDANLFDFEDVRIALRDLLQYLDKDSKGTFYTDFKDEITESVAGEPDFNVNKLDNYKKRVEHYLKGQRRDISVNKLRNNLPLGHRDLVHFEQILWNDLGSKDEYVEFYGDTPLLELVSGIVGLEPKAANKHFSTFLSDNSLNTKQREFVNMIVSYIIQNGLLPKENLRNTPFDKFGSITDLFHNQMLIARDLVGCIDKINTRIDVA